MNGGGAQDLEFHHANPARSLVLAPGDAEITAAMRHPPANTRAQVRSRLMHLLKGQTFRYFVDWEILDAEGFQPLCLMNLFQTESPEAEAWEQRLRELGP